MAYQEQYADDFGTMDLFAADAALDVRMQFIRRTYLHLFGAILAFMGLETIIFTNENLVTGIMGLFGQNWWMALIGFMIVTWLAERWAHSGASQTTQYAGLALYVVAETVIFVPLLWIAQNFGGPNVIPTAGMITLLIFGGLTGFVFLTRKDFSFMRGLLWMGSLAALGLILASAFMGFALGSAFLIGMVVLMAGWILYDTSNVLHHYRTDQHVAASLALFSSIATLFWYVLRLVMAFSDE